MEPNRLALGAARGARARIVLVLSENWTLVDARRPHDVVEMARIAEDTGIDTVMLSEHVVLGPSAGADGIMGNPRDYAMPGNQDPAMPWPDSIVLASAIAAATSSLRIALAAIIAPLRHPLTLAKSLATLDLLTGGRLAVQPTVSWHAEEYEALDVPFRERGARLDEHLAAWRELWRDSPATFAGTHYAFEDVYLEPKPTRPTGPRLWIGGSSVHPAVRRRLVEYGDAFHPLGQPSDQELTQLHAALRDAGRDPASLEWIGGIRGRFPDERSPADLAEALEQVPAQLARGFGTICVKPSQFIDDLATLPAFCRRVVEHVERAGPTSNSSREFEAS
ncbi:TIGR03619 family F420-dependent LLM class oxidoreductase [Egicoccus sp. AB-alg6-2]|uniref:TIGR03619 family F420-dependent LLM class oxidoreductase n=1 Tax=Egicoccus sp. AB-alg6-2 TaxID=3242692 RepID=UPI00359EEE84